MSKSFDFLYNPIPSFYKQAEPSLTVLKPTLERTTVLETIVDFNEDQSLSLCEFMSLVNKGTSEMTQAQFATGRVEFSAGSTYDHDNVVSFCITYERDETDAELLARQQAWDIQRAREVTRRQAEADRQAAENARAAERRRIDDMAQARLRERIALQYALDARAAAGAGRLAEVNRHGEALASSIHDEKELATVSVDQLSPIPEDVQRAVYAILHAKFGVAA